MTVLSTIISVLAAPSEKYFSQPAQYQYSILPFSVHVGSFASKCCNSCSCESEHATSILQIITEKSKTVISITLFFIFLSLQLINFIPFIHNNTIKYFSQVLIKLKPMLRIKYLLY